MSVSLADEVRGAALGDERLTKRLGKLIEQLGAKPNMSVPAATDGRAEMEAAYRFFDNDKVSPEKIFEPHIKEYYRCNIWHVRGRDRDLLIDSGMGVVSLREQIPLLSGRPLLAVASHTHFDHIGTHHEFADRAVGDAEDAP